jgi:DNA-binding NarL/FixJ family response regulator
MLQAQPSTNASPTTQRRALAALLTPAERAVLTPLSRGLSNKEIAAAVGKSPATIKTQVASILHKFGQPSRGRLIASLHGDTLLPTEIVG